jgi:methyl-accepting chemotaxis protein
MAEAQESGMVGDRARALAFARAVLEAFPELTGAYFGYEPNADGRDSEFVGSTAIDPRALGAGGRFIPYWFRDLDDPSVIRLAPLADMETSYYYRGVKNRFERRPEGEGITLAGGVSQLYRPGAVDALFHERTMITEPYVYEGKYIVEQTVPIVVDGRFIGIAGVDRALNDIDQFLAQLRGRATGDFILVSRRGRVIAATMDPALRTKPIEDTPYGAILKPIFERPSGETFELQSDPVRGASYYFAGTKIPTGGWTLAMAVPRDSVLAPLRRMTTESIAMSVVGTLIVLGILVTLMGSIARRIEVAADAAGKVSDGDLTVRVDPRAATRPACCCAPSTPW